MDGPADDEDALESVVIVLVFPFDGLKFKVAWTFFLDGEIFDGDADDFELLPKSNNSI